MYELLFERNKENRAELISWKATLGWPVHWQGHECTTRAHERCVYTTTAFPVCMVVLVEHPHSSNIYYPHARCLNDFPSPQVCESCDHSETS